MLGLAITVSLGSWVPCAAGTKFELTLNAMFSILRSFVISAQVCSHCELSVCLIVLIINKLTENLPFIVEIRSSETLSEQL